MGNTALRRRDLRRGRRHGQRGIPLRNRRHGPERPLLPRRAGRALHGARTVRYYRVRPVTLNTFAVTIYDGPNVRRITVKGEAYDVLKAELHRLGFFL